MKFLFLLPIVVLFFANPAHAIKKCKDADGNWHYGDTAVEECEASQVTTLNQRGVITDQLAAPKTEQELAAEKRNADQEQVRIAQERAVEEERLRILSIYESEADIDRLRQSQLNAVLSNMDVHMAYLKSMDSRIAHFQRQLQSANSEAEKTSIEEEISSARTRMADSKNELVLLVAEKKAINDNFDKELELYRSLRKGE